MTVPGTLNPILPIPASGAPENPLTVLTPDAQGRTVHCYGDFMKTKYVALAAFASTLLGWAALSQPVATHDSPRMIQITAKRFVFEPAEITVEQGEPVVLVVKSEDVAHGLRFHELNLDVKVSKGATVEAPFTPAVLGDFVGHCSVFCGSGHGQMTLTIHVVRKS
jgi:cytochrome c oxidase subunit 2